MKGFLDNFYNVDTLRGTLISDQAYQASWNLATSASATAAVACIPTWATDFRADLPKLDVPMLVVQGDADQVLPLDKTGKRLPGLIDDVQLVVIEGGPHAIPWTHADQVNTALLDFLGSYEPAQHAASRHRQSLPEEPSCRITSALTISSFPATTGAWTSPTYSYSRHQRTLTRRF